MNYEKVREKRPSMLTLTGQQISLSNEGPVRYNTKENSVSESLSALQVGHAVSALPVDSHPGGYQRDSGWACVLLPSL